MQTDFYVNGFYSLVGDALAEDFTPFLDPRRLRRAEKIAKNALFCALQACKQGSISIDKPHETGVSLAVGAGSLESTCKFMDSILTDGDELSSPTAFAGSVHNATGLTLSLFLNAHGPCVTTGQLDASFPAAWLTALQFLQSKMCRNVLVIAAEEINPVLAERAAKNPVLFSGLVRQIQGPFVRAAAAFLVSKEPSEKTQFCVSDFCFSREEITVFTAVSVSTPAQSALALAACLSEGKAFDFQDCFGGFLVKMRGKPYAF